MNYKQTANVNAKPLSGIQIVYSASQNHIYNVTEVTDHNDTEVNKNKIIF